MEYSHLYGREIACVRRAIKLPDARMPVSIPHTRHVVDVGPRAARSISSARDPTFLAPTTAPPPKGTSWAPDDAALTVRLVQLRSLAAELKGDAATSPLAAVQQEMAEKGCLQKGGLFGWDIMPDGIGLPGGDPMTGAYRFWFESLLEPKLYSPYAPSVPKDSNCGWPFYVTGLKGKVAMAMAVAAGGRALGRTRSLLSRAALVVGSMEEPSVLLLSRTGHTNKEMQAYESRASRIVTAEKVTGVAPRRRAVNAVSTGDNLVITSEAKGVQAILQESDNTPFYGVHPDLILARLLKGKKTIELAGLTPLQLEDDISAFDKSVRGHQQRSLSKEVYTPLWGADKAAEWLEIQWSPLLAPPVDLKYGAMLYDKPDGGETTSGMITTSTDGGLHNLTCAGECLAAAYNVPRETIVRWLKQGLITMLVWGDDTLYVLPAEGFSKERYMKRAAEIGYTRKLRKGGSFLGHWYDIERGVWYGFAVRSFLNTVFREHPCPGPASELAGLYFRWVPRHGHLDPYADLVWEMLQVPPSPLYDRKITTTRELEHLMSDPRFLRELETELKTAAGYAYIGSLKGAMLRGDSGTLSYASWIARTLGIGADEQQGVDPSPELYATDAAEAETRLFQMADHFAGGPLPPWYQAISTRVRVNEPVRLATVDEVDEYGRGREEED